MDRQQEEFQLLGFFGILKESGKLVSTWRKIFSQIILFLIMPLSFIYLIQVIIFGQILPNQFTPDSRPPEENGSYNASSYNESSYNQTSNLVSSKLTLIILFKIGYLIFFLTLALLSTSAVVYTIACIYTAKDVTFKKVMSVVPKVWKRLMMTFIWSFIFIFAFNVVSLILLAVGVFIPAGQTVKIVGFFLLLTVYLIGIVYLSMVWHLASVVSVLEESYGLKAMAKSQALIKGKMGVSVAIFLALGLCLSWVQKMFLDHVVIANGDAVEFGSRILFAVVSLALMSILMLFGLVVQTIIYFVCKSYHHENIDKTTLADHLGGYLGEYAPLMNKDVQLEHSEV